MSLHMTPNPEKRQRNEHRRKTGGHEGVKAPKDWLKTDTTQEYIDAVGRFLLTEQSQLVRVVQGGEPGQQGTWLHPKGCAQVIDLSALSFSEGGQIKGLGGGQDGGNESLPHPLS
jgi:hypothetical protein